VNGYDYRLTRKVWVDKNLAYMYMAISLSFPQIFMENCYFLDKLLTELSRDVIVINELGLHARSAAKIAEIARKANYNVWIIKDNKMVDASSILDILTLECAKGSQILVSERLY